MDRFLLAGLLIAFAAAPLAAASLRERERNPEAVMPMGSKVLFDRTIGFTVRFPYAWVPGDQYKMEVGEPVEGGTRTRFKQETINGRKVWVLTEEKTDPGVHPLRAFSSTFATPASSEQIRAWAAKQAGGKLTWRDWDYYQRPEARPHGDPKWAFDGISGHLGEAKDRVVLALSWGQGATAAAIVLARTEGYSADTHNRIMDAFEVMSASPKPKANERPKLVSWREHQTRSGNVIDRQGKPIRGGESRSVEWKDAWEIETPNYRILGNAGTGRLLQLGAFYEALHRAYTKIYQPERMPPYKAEVHIFNTCDQFEAGARAWIDPFFRARSMGGITGGFFVPRLQSLWVYEESGKLGGKDFTVEVVSAHECSHQFLHLSCNGSDHIPTWINEGLAVLFEQGVFSNGEFLLRPPKERISHLQSYYRRLKAPLIELDQYIDHGFGITAAQYGEVYAMTHFWIYGQGRDGLTRLQKFMRALRAGQDGGKAFEEIFMEDLIKAKGSRSEALKAWTQAHMQHVLSGRVLDLTPPR